MVLPPLDVSTPPLYPSTRKSSRLSLRLIPLTPALLPNPWTSLIPEAPHSIFCNGSPVLQESAFRATIHLSPFPIIYRLELLLYHGPTLLFPPGYSLLSPLFQIAFLYYGSGSSPLLVPTSPSHYGHLTGSAPAVRPPSFERALPGIPSFCFSYFLSPKSTTLL